MVLPYNTLLHKGTREASGIHLKGHVVVLDEGHNLLDTISNIHSVTVTAPQVAVVCCRGLGVVGGRRWGDIVSGQWCVVVDHIVSWWLVGGSSWFVMVGEETFKLIRQNEYIYIHIYKIHFHERVVLPCQTSRHILQHYFIITTPFLQFHSYLMAIFHNSSTFLSPPFHLSSTIFLCPFTFFNTPTFLQQPVPPPPSQFASTHNCLLAYLQRYSSRLSAKNIMYLKQLSFLFNACLKLLTGLMFVCSNCFFVCMFVCVFVCLLLCFFLFYTFPWLSYVHFAIFQSVKIFFFHSSLIFFSRHIRVSFFC